MSGETSLDEVDDTEPMPRVADHAMAFDLVGRLAGVVDEPTIIDRTLDLLVSLFAPTAVAWLPLVDGEPLPVRSHPPNRAPDQSAIRDLATLVGDYAWTDSGDGFRLRIGHSTQTLGVIEVSGLSFPSYRARYLNFAINFAPMLELLIANARQHSRLEAARESLRLERDRAQSYLDVAGAIIVAVAVNETVLLVNRRGCELLGREQDQIVGLNWFDSFVPEPECDTTRQSFARMVDNPSAAPEHAEGRVSTESGETRIIAWHHRVLRDDDGSVTGVLSSGEDVTDRRRSEAEQERLRVQLVQAQKLEAVGQLAAGLAHDFNNLLTVINGSAELLEMQLAVGDPRGELAQTIRGSGQRAARLISQLLAFSRKQMIAPRQVNLNDVVSATWQTTCASHGPSIRVVVQLAADLWPVRADAGQLGQLIGYLCDHARQSMPGGGTIAVSTANVALTEADVAGLADASPGEYVSLSVGDSGGGMSQEAAARIFEPFFISSVHVADGVGLRLAAVYGIVRQNGGHITVESDLGTGTTIKAYLPRLR